MEVSIHWLWGLPLAFGVAMLGITAAIAHYQIRFNASALRVQGLVVEIRETTHYQDGERQAMYCPQVAFTTVEGREVQFVDGSCASPSGHQVGEQVEVRYLPDAPEDARLGDTLSTWGASLTCGALGLTLTVVGGCFGWQLWPRRQRSTRRRSR